MERAINENCSCPICGEKYCLLVYMMTRVTIRVGLGVNMNLIHGVGCPMGYIMKGGEYVLYVLMGMKLLWEVV